MDANSIPIEYLKSEFKSRISFIHLVSSLIPEAVAKLEANGDIREIGTWVDLRAQSYPALVRPGCDRPGDGP